MPEPLLAIGGNGFRFSERLFPAKRPIGRPFFAWIRVMVISSPALNESRAQPCLAISCGLLVSTTQCVSSPLSSFTSTFRKQCGLAQSHSVRFPDTVMVLSLSYDAFPWCANSDIEIVHKLIAKAKIIASLCLILKSSVSMNFGRRATVPIVLTISTYLADAWLLANAESVGLWGKSPNQQPQITVPLLDGCGIPAQIEDVQSIRQGFGLGICVGKDEGHTTVLGGRRWGDAMGSLRCGKGGSPSELGLRRRRSINLTVSLPLRLSLAKILCRAELVLLRAPNHSLARLSQFNPNFGVTIPLRMLLRRYDFPAHL